MLKQNYLIYIIFALAGGFALFFSFNSFVHQWNFLKTASHSSGTVIENVQIASSKGRSTFSPVIEFYTQNGEKVAFKSLNSSNPPQYTIGQKVEVLYQPDNPKNAQIHSFFSFWLGTIFSGVLGFLFLGVGLGSVIKIILRKQLISRLQQFGMRVTAKVLRVKSVKTSDRRYGYKIVAQYEAEGKVYLFESDILAFQPNKFLGSEISVLVDPANYRKNYVEIDFLKDKLAN